ncbi:S-formylglutathione hydrolase FrmB [Kribbella amoyensis]|uniref:Acyl-CoA:diacylglycerol acyltransferase n=1 Tax=Kribbella amoyensis TaxID=996641 RepID=A0A561BSX6_9ACTN|nr:alpha/beta hydrolase-fold protein [Kribbella amoyensis]TWD81984.1 S-formylglutathione hydrolase FrmB [Kribbella amoyensis]
MSPRIGRRRFLAATAGTAIGAVVAAAAGVETGVLPGRARIHAKLGLTGEDGVVPDVAAGQAVAGTFKSAARRTTVGWTALYPQGQRLDARLPVVLMLHGRGGDHTSAVNDLGADRYLTQVVQSGTAPFALVAVDGGQDSYWHQRTTGDDPQRMLTAELLPLLAERGLRTDRYGVLGWSMGGYGALLLAADAGDRVVAAGAMSPALWHEYADVAPGAYDGPDDFARHQVFGRAELKDVALRIDCGRDDPFAGAVRDLREQVHAAGGIEAGAHTAGYWRRMLPDHLRFLGGEIAS